MFGIWFSIFFVCRKNVVSNKKPGIRLRQSQIIEVVITEETNFLTLVVASQHTNKTIIHHKRIYVHFSFVELFAIC